MISNPNVFRIIKGETFHLDCDTAKNSDDTKNVFETEHRMTTSATNQLKHQGFLYDLLSCLLEHVKDLLPETFI
ncbi:MAG: hypothetical protein O7E52_06030 [Candidatus Poribacteria bacterium]|nr:hypothetical protein [Candidatus Poribacteria bacterium]